MKYYRLFSKIKKFLLITFLLLIFSCVCAFSYINTVSAHISESVFRLHVIANSDTKEDQTLKYLVRDKLIAYINTLTNNCKSKESVISLVHKHIYDFEEIAASVIKENGFDYEVKIEIGNYYFPTKEYGDISLPAGVYDALRVKIGNAQGQNWWCVMFPPLCFTSVTSGIVPEDSKQLMHNELSDEEFYLISEDTPEIKFKFKLLELFNNMTNTLTAKK